MQVPLVRGVTFWICQKHKTVFMFTQLKQKLSRQRCINPEVISYQTIRRAIGWLGILLPFGLVLGSFILGQCSVIQPSISHYYYTNMREVFVGTLCAVSLFLFSYKGFSLMDSMSANIAGLFALGVALFPTDIICENDGYHACQNYIVSLTNIPFHATIHFTCAACFFVTLALMSIFLFTKSNQIKEKQTAQKRKRNIVYVVCGVIMILSIVILGIYFIENGNKDSRIVFSLETLSLLAFGISWLTKGEALFGDKPPEKDQNNVTVR
jgi:uncharacterized protein DUF998